MSTSNGNNGPSEPDVMTAIVSQQLSDKLTEAAALARDRLPDELDRVRDILSDLVYRVEAFELTRARDAVSERHESDAARAARGGDSLLTRCCSAVLASEKGAAATEWLLVPFGDNNVERPLSGGSFVFTRQHAESATRWFDQLGRKLAIDYEHQSFDQLNTRPDGLRPAAGWIGGLEVREDGLWAVDVSWTERARELLRSGEYRYFSPVIYWTDEDHSDLAGLGPVALTNDPALHGVSPLAASRAPTLKLHDDTHEPHDALDNAADDSELVPRRLLDDLELEVSVLKRHLRAREADQFIERGLRSGKILDSNSMDWREDYLRDPENVEQRLRRAPVLLPPGRVLKLDPRGDPLPAPAGQLDHARHADFYKRWGVEPEDLAAFERAFADGRIIGASAR